MDTLHNPQRLMRPVLNPQHQQHHQPPLPPHPQAPWYPAPAQFQYQAQSHLSNQPQWAHHNQQQQQQSMAPGFGHNQNPPSSYNPSSMASSPYAMPLHQQYGPPPPPPPPPPPRPLPPQHHHSQVTPMYAQADQPWGNMNRPHHQSWEYPGASVHYNNEEDWAAKARAWAAAKAAMENQQAQAQFTPLGKVEDHTHAYHNQSQNATEPHFADIQQSSLPAPSHHPPPVAPPMDIHRTPNHFQDSISNNSEPLPLYASNESLAFSAADKNLVPLPPSSSAPVASQGNMASISSVYRQEVSLNYSSFPGVEERGNTTGASPLPVSPPVQVHKPQTILPAVVQSDLTEHPHFTYGDQSSVPLTDPSDQPLVFDKNFTRNLEQRQQTSYTHSEPMASMGGPDHVHAWTPAVAPGAVFPPAPTGPQFDPTFLPPAHPLPGHPQQMFGRIPGPNFRPNIPPISSPFGLNAGAALPPGSVFPGDANGTFSTSERPKKASVPNWLREEIMKKKAAVMASSVQDPSSEHSVHTSGDEDKSLGKVDQADSKSIDSARSTEDEDDEEEEVEAARTAAINQEIKHVLTEVLLKVTGELFDEIATEVLEESDLIVEVEHSNISRKDEVLPPVIPTPKASARVLVPVEAKDGGEEEASERSGSSGPAGDVLGLSNYASDDDEEAESSEQLLNGEDRPNSLVYFERPNRGIKDSGHDVSGVGDLNDRTKEVPSDGEKEMRTEIERVPDEKGFSYGNSERISTITGGHEVGSLQGSADTPKVKEKVGGNAHMNFEIVGRGSESSRTGINDLLDSDGRKKTNKSNDEESKRTVCLVSSDYGGDVEAGNSRATEKHSSFSDNRRGDDRDVRKGRVEERDKVKEKEKERKDKVKEKEINRGDKVREKERDRGDKMREKERDRGDNMREKGRERVERVKECEKDEKETVKRKRDISKEESIMKSEHGRDNRDGGVKHGDRGSSHKHKRHRSSSISGRGKNSRERDNSSPSRTSGTDVEASDNSRHRRVPSKKHSLSPSPVRSRKRQVSRSPHEKHSQRRHSPYSSPGTRLVFQVGLLSVWVAGLLLIAFSLYAIQLLPSLKDQIKPRTTQKDNEDGGFSVTIFSAPNPFEGLVGARQVFAIHSWLALSQALQVVLFTQHPSALTVANTLGSRVTVETAIDFTFTGTPFFHSMISRSRASNSDVSVVIDPDTVVLSDFISVLCYAHKLNHDWLLIATSSSVSDFPFYFDNQVQQWLREGGQLTTLKKLQEFLAQKQKWRTCGDRMLFAWNTGQLPLHAGVLPPFLYSRGFCNQWVLNEALSSNLRFVFDASEVISSFFSEIIVHHHSSYLRNSEVMDREKNWEYEGNADLSASYGSFYFRPINFSKKLVKLVRCDGQYLFKNPPDEIDSRWKESNMEPSQMDHSLLVQNQRSSSLWKTIMLHSWRNKKRLACLERGNLSNMKSDCPNKEKQNIALNVSAPLLLPFSLESLLQTVAIHEKYVVLAIVGDNYRDMLMSWVCRLRHLQISNFIVCALDPKVYQFSVLQGLPVFKDGLAPKNISFDDCHFGTKCFQRVTKVKSRIVLQILKLGYDVLLSDVDIYWFSNPIPYLRSFGPSVLVAQSDEYNETVPINLPRRLNSGFYFAHSDGTTITAMEMVVEHASTSDLSEQPSFYDILCGEGGKNRVGPDKCMEPTTNLTVHFLNRNLFPNGAYRGLWEKKNVTKACAKIGCVVLHNNWISGRKRKLQRQVSSGLWAYDPGSRMCLHSWWGPKLTRSF
ncbi:hypothetical protein AMTRI_Chr06g176810 [Amborella trichopoda]